MLHPQAEKPTAASVVVARVPVVDRVRSIVGFELVSRPVQEGPAYRPSDTSEAVVTVSSLLASVQVDLVPVVGDKLLFCTVDHAVLLSETRLGLPPRRTVLEVPTTGIDAPLLAGIGAYRRAGFGIMVRHEKLGENAEALLALTDLVRIHVRSGTPGEVMDVVDRYRRHDVDVLAAGCDTEAQLAWAQAVGFDLFVGRAVQVQETTSQSLSAPMPLSKMQLSMQLLSRDLELDRIEEVLRGDPALVVQLLNMASVGAGRGLRRQVRSLREALVVMGTARIRQWAALVILSRHSRRESDALVTTLVRARMCELLAPARGVDPSFAFTAGLLSALHILLGVPAADVEKQVNVDDELAEAAFGRQGPVGQLITRVEDHEQWLAGSLVPPDHDEVTLVGAQAFGWATRYAELMDSAA